MLTKAEIMGLLTELCLDELYQPVQNADVFDRALATILRHYELNSRPRTISAINSLPGQDQGQELLGQTETNQEIDQTDAANSSADLFVNRPWLGDAWPSEMRRQLGSHRP